MTNRVITQLTNGFGNNIFQYVAAKLLAEHHNLAVYALPAADNYYAVPDLEGMGVNFLNRSQIPTTNVRNVDESNYLESFDVRYSDTTFLLNGYFEDYKLYVNKIEHIKTWFPSVSNRDNKALVVHMRTGDRLFMKNEFYSKPRVENYLEAISHFDFDEFHIVTDMPKWDYVTAQELQDMKFHLETPADKRVPITESVNYFNAFVEGFDKFKPIMKKRSVAEDFNFIRTFKNILFEHGTLSWWASVLSDAEKVGVYGPWRPWKGATNKNLSQIPLEGWFRWQ